MHHKCKNEQVVSEYTGENIIGLKRGKSSEKTLCLPSETSYPCQSSTVVIADKAYTILKITYNSKNDVKTPSKMTQL